MARLPRMTFYLQVVQKLFGGSARYLLPTNGLPNLASDTRIKADRNLLAALFAKAKKLVSKTVFPHYGLTWQSAGCRIKNDGKVPNEYTVGRQSTFTRTGVGFFVSGCTPLIYLRHVHA